jgi:hypothetical protein
LPDIAWENMIIETQGRTIDEEKGKKMADGGNKH